MNAAEDWARLEQRDGRATLCLEGSWRVASLPALDAALDALKPSGQIDALDGAGLKALDTAGALAALRFIQSTGADPASTPRKNFDARHLRILEVVASRLDAV